MRSSIRDTAITGVTMLEKYNLNEMLEEIREDDQEGKKSAARIISQEDIKRIILEKKKKKKDNPSPSG